MSVSIYPCSLHGKRIVGRLGAIYPALLYRGSRRSAKLRVCDPCLDNLFATLGSKWTRAEVDSEDAPSAVCGSCGKQDESLGERHAFFLTVYRRGEEREDWFGQYCAGCASDVVDTLSLTG